VNALTVPLVIYIQFKYF